MNLKQSRRADPDIHYQLPVSAHYRGENLPATLIVKRRADGNFWEGRLFVNPALHMTVNQTASPINGGFSHLSDEDFLDRVRLVFDFCGGAEFDFVSDDYRPRNLQ
ncbi:hypothetical protein [Tardiphaga robiniae]|uniref:Uncharacterized protein n=1 Tax=Tardiphaga robiniae TaxID=943830 RepID=A0A120MG45_9BRAD|nr:hypothetical protein [Tardiphaga robiniae]AMH39530.1 hypothetical protein PROKKA_00719 [Tardiphaga robiniae]KZD25502.1 hypothetical protein A4A58_03560 [Tardiphaga robiniae]